MKFCENVKVKKLLILTWHTITSRTIGSKHILKKVFICIFIIYESNLTRQRLQFRLCLNILSFQFAAIHILLMASHLLVDPVSEFT